MARAENIALISRALKDADKYHQVPAGTPFVPEEKVNTSTAKIGSQLRSAFAARPENQPTKKQKVVLSDRSTRLFPGTRAAQKASESQTRILPIEATNQIIGAQGINAIERFSSTLSQAISQGRRNARQRLEDAPTPGSIWLPLGMLLALLFVLIPVNGHTRIVWLFLTLAGHAQIGPPGTAGANKPDVTNEGGGGVGSDFANTYYSVPQYGGYSHHLAEGY